MSGPSTVPTVAVALCLGVFFSRRLWWSLQSSCSVNEFAVSPPKDLWLNLQPCTTLSVYDDSPPPTLHPGKKKKKKAITCQCFPPPKDLSVDQSTIQYHIILYVFPSKHLWLSPQRCSIIIFIPTGASIHAKLQCHSIWGFSLFQIPLTWSTKLEYNHA